MKLGGIALARQFQTGNWRAYKNNNLMDPSDVEKLIGPNSIDVTLHEKLLVIKNVSPQNERWLCPEDCVIDPHDPDSIEWEEVIIPEEGYILESNGFVLGAVNERFVCFSPVCVSVGNVSGSSYFAPMYEGRSTCGRIGIESHLSAGFGDHGFSGAFTTEIVNNSIYGIRLYKNMRIGQVAFDEVYEPKIYKGAYSKENHYDGPVAPKLGKDRF
jgi:dCTP deaminase